MTINGVLNYKDKNGDVTTVYPVTSAENVAGLSAALAGKVDKETGKGLSANDYTTTEKEKLAGIEVGANAYTLPKATTTSLGGIQVGTDLNIDSSTGSLSVNKTSSVTSGSGELVTSGGVYAALENKVDKVAGKGLSSNDYSDNDKNKLSGIEAGAEVNVQADWKQTTSTADDYIKNKPTLGTAAEASASDFATAAQGTKADNAIPSSAKGTANGVAELDSNGLVPASQLPSFVDDVLEYASYSGFPETGETGKIYVDKSDNKTYRWSGSTYVEISSSLALGTTSSTAFRGDRGQTAYEHATDASRLTTAKTSGLYKIAATAEGHVASATPVTKSDITALGIPAQDTTYSEATTSASGLMSASDKSKLNGIEAQANKTVVDSALSTTSTNPVQNQIVTAKINEIENRIFYITPEMFNAAGDGSTDDTIAFLSMFSYARENDTAIRIPAKRYKITSSLEVSDLTIVGTSPSSNGADYGSTIVYTGTGYTFFTEAHKRAFISNIQFVGNGQNNGLNIKQYSGYEGYYDCLSFMNFMTAIRVDGNDNRFTRIQIIQCGDVSCSASDTPNYAIVSSLGLQNYFENCHIEHTRYMVSGVSSSLFFVNCKFEQSTYGIASANLASPISVGGFCAFNACYFVAITIAAYIKASIVAADAPYFVSIANSTIVSGCTFIVGMGSGNYKHTSPNYTTGKFITSTRGNVSGNYFGTITRQAPAFALSYGAFCNNSIYVANAGEPTETVRTTLSDTVIFLGNAAANGAISDIFIISETGINNFLTVGFTKTGSYTIRHPYVIKSDGYSLRFAMHITSIMLPVGWTELGTLATDNLSFRNAVGKVFMAIINSDDNTTDYGVVPLIIRESGKLEVYNNGDVPTDVNVRISTDTILPV